MKFPEIVAVLVKTATVSYSVYKELHGADDIIFDTLALNIVEFFGDPDVDGEEILSFGSLRANIIKGVDPAESTKLFLEDFLAE